MQALIPALISAYPGVSASLSWVALRFWSFVSVIFLMLRFTVTISCVAVFYLDFYYGSESS